MQPAYDDPEASRFIRPGARRIACTSNHDDFMATAFLNPDGKIAVVIFNTGDKQIFFQVWIHEKAVRYETPAKAVITMILEPVVGRGRS